MVRSNQGTDLREEKEGLIDLIRWYRDEYHKQDFGHSRMMEEVEKVDSLDQLEPYYRIIDDWLE